MKRFYLTLVAALLFGAVGCDTAPPVATPPSQAETEEQQQLMEAQTSQMMQAVGTDAAPEGGLPTPGEGGVPEGDQTPDETTGGDQTEEDKKPEQE